MRRVLSRVVGLSVFVSGVANAQACNPSPCPIPPQMPAVYFEFQVQTPVKQAPGMVPPRYPDSLRVAKVNGEVIASFVVDTTGLADTTTLKILKSTHDLFSASVHDALPQMRFIPAELGGRKVAQLVQQPFYFAISP